MVFPMCMYSANMYSSYPAMYAYPTAMPNPIANMMMVPANNVVYSGLAANYPGSLTNQTITNPDEKAYKSNKVQNPDKDVVVDDFMLSNGTRVLGIVPSQYIHYGNANDGMINVIAGSNTSNPVNMINPAAMNNSGINNTAVYSPYSGNYTYSGPTINYPGPLAGRVITYPDRQKDILSDLQKGDTKNRVIGDYMLPSGGRVVAYVAEKDIRYYDANIGPELRNINVLS